MSLYLFIDLASISVPFLVSFHPKFKLHKNWGALFGAIFLAMIPYIIWDVIFTVNEYWGFNPAYLNGLEIAYLPIEEWLFFICIPYACVFTHVTLTTLLPKVCFSKRVTKTLTFAVLSVFLFIALANSHRWYTFINAIFVVAILLLAYFTNTKLLRSYFFTFLIMLIPFFIVNGVLTGTGITDEVVWYNNAQNLGVRLGTIPVEDVGYAFSLLLLNLLLFERFKNTRKFSR